MVRSLTAGNRELALGTSAAEKTRLTELGINALPNAERAQLLSSTSVFDASGIRETDAYGPVRQITLESNLTSGSTTVAAAGSQLVARAHTVKTYDAGRPSDGTATVKDQLTQQTVGGQPRSRPDLMADPRVVATGFDWVKGVATSSTQDPGGLAITTTTAYDAQGRVSKTTQPASTGNDAGAMFTTYYMAGGTGTCGGRPEWADLVCQTGPSAAITGGGTNPTQLPTRTVEYGLYGQATRVTETANSVTRTTTLGYDTAGRPTTVTIAGGAVPPFRRPLPATTTSADRQTSRPPPPAAPSRRRSTSSAARCLTRMPTVGLPPPSTTHWTGPPRPPTASRRPPPTPTTPPSIPAE